MKYPKTPPTYPNLKLNRNPFIQVAPVSRFEEDMRPLFTARSAEVERICRLTSAPRALFVVAPYGGGKTVVLLEALSRMREAGTVAVYSSFERDKGFRYALIHAMKSSGIKLDEGAEDALQAVRYGVRELIAAGRRVVLATDDLDRAHDIAEIFQVTHDVRDLLADGASVVVTGQPFGVTFDLHTSAGGVFNEVRVPEFTASEFREMMQIYLKSVHTELSAHPSHPFDDAGTEFICDEMSGAKMTPRLFNFAVSALIDTAEGLGLTSIPIAAVLEHWPAVARKTVAGLQELQLRHLSIILKQAVVSEDTPKAIAELGGHRLAEFPEVQEGVLRPLVEKNLVYVRKEGGKEQYRLTKHAAAAISEILPTSEDGGVCRPLAEQWRTCCGEKDRHRKGESLEKFVAAFLRSIPGFSIPSDGLNLRTNTEELDVLVEIVGYQHHVQYGVLTVCECKNWSTAVAGDVLSHLRDKLKERGCIFGVFVAVNDVLPGFRDKMKAYLHERIVIALLTGADFDRLEKGATPATILRDSYYSTVKYIGEKRVPE